MPRGKKMPHEVPVEVDLIPYIDVVTLLLMFLLIIGDMASSTTSVKMKLPRADQAKNERAVGIDTEGRIVVQIQKNADGKYVAFIEKHQYELIPRGNNASLTSFLKELIERREAKKQFTRGANGEVSFPVKLRVPQEAPMYEVERVVTQCARVGLVNVHYAADPHSSN